MDFRKIITLVERAQEPGLDVTQEASPFEKWFAGSKVVDAQGKPLKLFHGTSKDQDFRAFKMPRNGVWFTTDPKSASDYAADNDSQGYKMDGWEYKKTHTASRVIPCFVKMLNPLVVDSWPERLQYATNYKKAQAEWFDLLRAKRYDGVIAPGGIFVAIGDPTQIKSAVGNTKFDPSKKNIDETDEDPNDLEHFGHEGNFNIRKGDHDEPLDDNDSDLDSPASFPSGGQWFICTDWACYVRRELGDRAKIYGFDISDKRRAGAADDDYSRLDQGFDGHDFAVVDDRFIVDGWVKNIEGMHDKAVIDMKDPKNAKLIQSIYGNPKFWDRNEKLEQIIDRETPEARARAFRGVKRFQWGNKS